MISTLFVVHVLRGLEGARICAGYRGSHEGSICMGRNIAYGWERDRMWLCTDTHRSLIVMASSPQ